MANSSKPKQGAHFEAWRLNKNTMYRWRYIDERGNIVAESHHGYARPDAAIRGGKRALTKMAKESAQPAAAVKLPAPNKPPVMHGGYETKVDTAREEVAQPKPRKGFFAGLRRRG